MSDLSGKVETVPGPPGNFLWNDHARVEVGQRVRDSLNHVCRIISVGDGQASGFAVWPAGLSPADADDLLTVPIGSVIQWE